MLAMLFLSTFLLVCVSSLITAQRIDGQFWPCNPTKNATGKCTPNRGLTASSYSIDFTKQTSIPDGWTLSNFASLKFGSRGAEFTFNKRGDAPQLWTNFFMLGCKYEIVAQVAPGIGMISSSVLMSDDFDEIDFEFSGNNFGFSGTNGVGQNNYFGKGITGSYDRGQWFSVEQPMSQFHTYSIDWNSERVIWGVDGKVLRTFKRNDGDKDTHQYPQSPSKLQIGIWDGGDPDGNQGTVNWAGGYTDLTKAPYTMYVKSINIVNYTPACAYNWTDQSGNWESIKAISDQNACNSIFGNISTGTASKTSATAATAQSNYTSSVTTTAIETVRFTSSFTATTGFSPTSSAVKITAVLSLPSSTANASALAPAATSTSLAFPATSQSVAVISSKAADVGSQQSQNQSTSLLDTKTRTTTITSNTMITNMSTNTSSPSISSQTMKTVVTVHTTSTSYIFATKSSPAYPPNTTDAKGQAALATGTSHSSSTVYGRPSTVTASSLPMSSYNVPESLTRGVLSIQLSSTVTSPIAVPSAVCSTVSKSLSSTASTTSVPTYSGSIPAKDHALSTASITSSSSTFINGPKYPSSGGATTFTSSSTITMLTDEAADIRTVSNLQALIGLIQRIIASILGRKSRLGEASNISAATATSTGNYMRSVQSEAAEVLKKVMPKVRRPQKHRREAHHLRT